MTIKKAIIGVPGAGKTTLIAELIKSNKIDLNNIVFTSLTNATIRALLTKTELSKKILSIRTIYGLAYIELDRNLLLTEENKKSLKNPDKIKKTILRKHGILATDNILKDTDSVFVSIVLNSLEKNKDLRESIADHELLVNFMFGKKRYYRILDYLSELVFLYEMGKFYDYIFLLYDSIRNNLDFFNVYKSLDIINPNPTIVFDEFQDVPKVIIDYVKSLGKNMIILGDPAQSIFSWLRTQPNIYTEAKKVFYLNKTKRFGDSISKLANDILRRAGYHYKILSDAEDDQVYIVDSRSALSDLLSYVYKVYKGEEGSIIVLTRTRYQAKLIEKNLERLGYDVVSIEYIEYDRLLRVAMKYIKSLKEKKGILFYLNKNKQDTTKTIKNKHIEKYINAILEKRRVVFVSTVHNVKGLEFDNVIYYNSLPRKVVSAVDLGISNKKEEYKVLYVGVTRAKKNLYIINDINRYYLYI